jgi:hypothetical protein
MATKDEIAKRLREYVGRHEMERNVGLSDLAAELAAILAEQDSRIAALAKWATLHDHSVDGLP